MGYGAMGYVVGLIQHFRYLIANLGLLLLKDMFD